MWTLHFHVRSYSMGDSLFYLFSENLIFRKRLGVATYFIFYFFEREKQNKKEKTLSVSSKRKTGMWKTKISGGQVTY